MTKSVRGRCSERQRAVEHAPGELRADQERDGDEAERREPQRGAVKFVEQPPH